MIAEQRRRTAAIAIVAVTAAAFAASAAAQTQRNVSGGTGTIYVGTYAKTILVVDEASLRVTDTIPVAVGIPTSIAMSQDRTRFYVRDPQYENVEIFDVKTRASLDRFTLSQGNKRVRINGFSVDPLHRFAVLLIKTYTKQSDRFEIGRPTLVRYDLAKKTVTDTIRWPRNQEREFAQIVFSPKGDLMYFFTPDDVLIYSTDSLKQVDRWEMQRVVEEGFGRLPFGFGNDVYEEPGFNTGLFRITDPVNRRTLMGIARTDLVNRSVDYYTLGPTGPVGAFRVAPGRRRAYGLRQEVGNYEFWEFDLENRRVVRKVTFTGRPRMGLTPSSNGRFLYIHTAGPTIDLYDVSTFRLARTVDLGADMTSFILIPPAAATPAPR